MSLAVGTGCLPVRMERPGALIVATSRHGIAVSFRIIRHGGATVTVYPGNRSNYEFVGQALSQWFGWYSSRILANGWEPYDQPDPAAYLPLRFDALAISEQFGFGVLLRQHRPDRLVRLVGLNDQQVMNASEEALPTKICELLRAAGVPDERVSAASQYLS
jgi:hypothetical protein